MNPCKQLQHCVHGEKDVARPIHQAPKRDPNQVRVVPCGLRRELLDATQDTRNHQAEKARPRRIGVRLAVRVAEDAEREEQRG